MLASSRQLGGNAAKFGMCLRRWRAQAPARLQLGRALPSQLPQRIGDANPHLLQGERTLFKRAKGAFCDTDLEAWLRGRGITHLLIAGVTTEVGTV
jgi:nicotinamidase-related amidase